MLRKRYFAMLTQATLFAGLCLIFNVVGVESVRAQDTHNFYFQKTPAEQKNVKPEKSIVETEKIKKQSSNSTKSHFSPEKIQ